MTSLPPIGSTITTPRGPRGARSPHTWTVTGHGITQNNRSIELHLTKPGGTVTHSGWFDPHTGLVTCIREGVRS
jgi:hypothetical protein